MNLLLIAAAIVLLVIVGASERIRYTAGAWGVA